MGVCCQKIASSYIDVNVQKESEFAPLKTKEKYIKIKTVYNKTPNLSTLLPELIIKKKKKEKKNNLFKRKTKK